MKTEQKLKGRRREPGLKSVNIIPKRGVQKLSRQQGKQRENKKRIETQTYQKKTEDLSYVTM